MSLVKRLRREFKYANKADAEETGATIEDISGIKRNVCAVEE